MLGTKLMAVGDEDTNESIAVDVETIYKVNAFKYLGAIKTSTDSCSEDTKGGIGKAKKATMELDTIWKQRNSKIPQYEIGERAHMTSQYFSYVYVAEGWTLKKYVKED